MYSVDRHDTQACALQNVAENENSSGSYISQPCCEPAQEKQAWEQPSHAHQESMERPEMAQRKIKIKCKAKTQKDKDAEKVKHQFWIHAPLSTPH